MSRRRPTYSKQDLIDEGITAKRLRVWMEEGLFTPELGSQPGKETRYTEADLDALAVVKKLVVDEKYEIATVKKMLGAVPIGQGLVARARVDLSKHYWDYNLDRWVIGLEIAERQAATARSAEELGETAKLVWVAWLMMKCQELRSPKAFQADIEDAQKLLASSPMEVLKGLTQEDGAAEPVFDLMRRVYQMRSEVLLVGRQDSDRYRKELAGHYREHPDTLWAIFECNNCEENLAVEEVSIVEHERQAPFCGECEIVFLNDVRHMNEKRSAKPTKAGKTASSSDSN